MVIGHWSAALSVVGPLTILSFNRGDLEFGAWNLSFGRQSLVFYGHRSAVIGRSAVL